MLIVCFVLVDSLQNTMDKSGYDMRNLSQTVCWYEGRFLFVSLFRDNRCFVLSLCPLYLYFFKFCNYSL